MAVECSRAALVKLGVAAACLLMIALPRYGHPAPCEVRDHPAASNLSVRIRQNLRLLPKTVSALRPDSEGVLVEFNEVHRASWLYLGLECDGKYMPSKQHAFRFADGWYFAPESGPDPDKNNSRETLWGTGTETWTASSPLERYGLGFTAGMYRGRAYDIEAPPPSHDGVWTEPIAEGDPSFYHCPRSGVRVTCPVDTEVRACQQIADNDGSSARSGSFASFGWYAVAAPRYERVGALVWRELRVEVGRLSRPPSMSCSNQFRERGMFVPLGGDYRKQVSIESDGRLQRNLSIYGFSETRARLVMQTGVADPYEQTIDDDLVAIDLCLRQGSTTKSYDVRSCSALDEPLVLPATGVGPGGSRVAVTLPDVGGWEGDPRFSPGGNWIAFLRTDPRSSADTGESVKDAEGSDESLQRDLWIVRNTRTLQGLGDVSNAVNLTADLDRTVLEYEWSCGGRCLLAKVAFEGETPVIQIDYEERSASGRSLLDLSAWSRPSTSSLRKAMAVGEGEASGTELVYRAKHSAYIEDMAATGSGRTLFLIESALTGPNRKAASRVLRCQRDMALVGSRFECEQYLPPEGGYEPFPVGDEVAVERLEAYKQRRTVASGDTSDSVPNSGVEDDLDGVPYLQGFIFYPPCFSDPRRDGCVESDLDNGKFPVIVHVHGGPHNATYNRGGEFFLGHLLRGHGNPNFIGANGFVVVAPNPAGSVGYGDDYLRRAARDWGGQPYQDVLDTIRFFREDDGFARTVKGRKLDRSRLFVTGQSYGGYVVNLLQSGKVPAAGSRPAVTGLVSLFGPFDTKSFPCETDQQWFPLHQFGYNVHNCEEGKRAHYRPQDDPANFFDCEQASIDGAAMSKACEAIDSERPIRRFPMLVLHGSRDGRVRIDESIKLARGMIKANELRSELGEEPTPFRACRVVNGDHGFSHEMYGELHIAMIRWFTCIVKGQTEACRLMSLDGEDQGQDVEGVYQLICDEPESWDLYPQVAGFRISASGDSAAVQTPSRMLVSPAGAESSADVREH